MLYPKTIDLCIVDADDIKLVEMLANLAEQNDVANNVDNDSVLGSQYSIFSEPAQNDPEEEEEEVEDLNITSLDLDSISSWELTHKRFNYRDNTTEHDKNNRVSLDDVNVIEESYIDDTLINLPQLDGVDDLYINVLEHEEKIVNRSTNNTSCCTAVLDSPKNTKRNSCEMFTILSVDGATASDPSDSESEVDVTIDKQEKRICVYKSGKRDTLHSTAQITPKKKRPNDDNDLESLDKRKNMNARTPKRQLYNSPNKVYQSPSRNYSPLDITITSPKTRSPTGRCESPKRKQLPPISDIPSTSMTPKRKTQLLRVSLLREKRTSLLNSGNLCHSKFVVYEEFFCKQYLAILFNFY